MSETKRYLIEYWKRLHKVPIHEVKRRDIAVRLTDLSEEHGPVAAARARNALSGIFAWAMREGIVDANPVIGTNKPPEPPSRDRVLTDAELAGIWTACRDNDYGRIVKLALLTGARREEIGGLRWQEVDIERAELICRRSGRRMGVLILFRFRRWRCRSFRRRLGVKVANICLARVSEHSWDGQNPRRRSTAAYLQRAKSWRRRHPSQTGKRSR